jgi:hypothetical protein
MLCGCLISLIVPTATTDNNNNNNNYNKDNKKDNNNNYNNSNTNNNALSDRAVRCWHWGGGYQTLIHIITTTVRS